MKPAALTSDQQALTDREIVQRIAGGDDHAFTLLMRRHNQKMYRTARGILRDDAEAEDDAMRHSNSVWNEVTLDRFLATPLKAVPGTSMGYAGVIDAEERADLIAYLKWANASEPCGK